MKDILTLLNKVRQRPNIYLGRPSLERLSAFIDGGICLYQEITGIYLEFAPGFDDFVHEQYKIYTAHSAASLITFFSDNDEQAFYTFFELLDQYLTLKGKPKD